MHSRGSLELELQREPVASHLPARDPHAGGNIVELRRRLRLLGSRVAPRDVRLDPPDGREVQEHLRAVGAVRGGELTVVRDWGEGRGAVRVLPRFTLGVGEGRSGRLPGRLRLPETVLVAADLRVALAADHDLLHRLVLVELDVVPVPEVVLAVGSLPAELHPHHVPRGRSVGLGFSL